MPSSALTTPTNRSILFIHHLEVDAFEARWRTFYIVRDAEDPLGSAKQVRLTRARTHSTNATIQVMHEAMPYDKYVYPVNHEALYIEMFGI